jgi:hypothetical protein
LGPPLVTDQPFDAIQENLADNRRIIVLSAHFSGRSGQAIPDQFLRIEADPRQNPSAAMV